MARDHEGPAGPPVISIDPCDPFAGNFLVAALAWPQSEGDRKKALATFWADTQDRLDVDGGQRAEAEVAAALQAAADAHGCTPADILALPGAREFEAEAWRDLVAGMNKAVADALLWPSGGHRAVADAPGLNVITEQAHQAQRSGAIVGQALCLIASMAHLHPDIPASMNRTWAVMQAEALPRGGKVPEDRASLVRLWGEWCGSAPLHAAVHLWFVGAELFAPDPRAEKEAMFSTPRGVGTVLAWAKWFRAWGTDFRPDRARAPLLPPDTALLYDTKGVDVPAIKPLLWPLSALQLAAARGYRAPTSKFHEPPG
jgi:hypothetical protein